MTQNFNEQPQGESVDGLIEGKPKGHAFKFKLEGGNGGTYRTPEAMTVEEVETELTNRFGVFVESVELKGKA